MKSKAKFGWCILATGILLLRVDAANAQLRFPTTGLLNQADFRQHLDVYDWQYNLGWRGGLGGLEYALGLNILSSMLQRPRGNKWKDNDTGFWLFRKPLSSRSVLLGQIQHTLFRDELSSFNYDRRLTSLTLANAWHFKSNIELQPELGYRWEKRAELLEPGAYAGLTFSFPKLQLNEYSNSLYLLGQTTRFSKRKNSNLRIDYSVWREFQPGTADSMAFYYAFYRRDNYFSNPLLGRIESLRKNQKGIENFLRYRMSRRARLQLRTALSVGKVSIQRLEANHLAASRNHDDFNFSNQVRFLWRGERLQASVELGMGESAVNYDIPDSTGFLPFSRRFATLGYDIAERYTRFAHRLMYKWTSRDSLRFYVELGKVEHDNSDQQNPDSYDEQKWQVALLHQHRFNAFMTVIWEANVFLKHFVYLDASLSAQNNWSRLFQFQPTVRIHPGSGFLFQQRVGVRAQYVDFDFDRASPVTNSYVIRDFYLADSLVSRLTSKISLLMHYRFEMEELGTLNWRAFSSRPRSLWRNHWFNLSFAQDFNPRLNFTAGVIFYQQIRYQYLKGAGDDLILKKTGAHTNLGPAFQISYRAYNGSTLYFGGDRQKVSPFSGKSYYVNNLQLTVQWTF